MNAYRIKPLRFPWAPVYYLAAGLTAAGCGAFLPVSSLEHGHMLAMSAGLVLALVGVALVIWAIGVLLSHRTPVLPIASARHLVTCGPFRISRNPIYLGYTLVLAALALATDNAWFAVFGFAAAVATNLVAVKAEEKHLLARFGIEFERYCQRTRRWI
ncbi:methyltransferase family protein [Rhizobium sp. PAMB 3182]